MLCKILDKEITQKDHVGKPPSSIVMPDYVLIPVKKVESFDYDGPVYNLEVDDVSSYVSENAILHNCGDFGIVNAIQMALSEMQIPKHKAAIFSGIGCSGKTSHFINVFGVHTLHGRVLTFAQGAKLANPDMEIIAVGGDGDGLGIGAGHFVAAGRRNLDLTYIIFNNGVYGLTKGQASPTLKLGEKTKSLPTPNTNYDVNPIGLAIASGFTFVARGYAYDVRQLKDLIIAAVKHKGLAFLDVLQPCPTYNDINTRDWYAGADQIDPITQKPRPRTYRLEDTDYDPVVHYDEESELNERLTQALIKSLEWGTKIPTGIFYKNEIISQYDRRIMDKIPNYLENPPASQVISANDKPTTDLTKILDSLSV
jgi:2-oxoglutarate ferredoxin oxidoreductase subunit beta